MNTLDTALIGAGALAGAYWGWTYWLPMIGYTETLAKVLSLSVPVMAGTFTGMAIAGAMDEKGLKTSLAESLVLVAVGGVGLAIQYVPAELLESTIPDQTLRSIVAPAATGIILQLAGGMM